MHTSTHICVRARADKGIVAQVATDVGRDDFTVDAVAGNKVLVLPWWRIVAWRVIRAGASSAVCHFIVVERSRFQETTRSRKPKARIAKAVRSRKRKEKNRKKQYGIAQMQRRPKNEERWDTISIKEANRLRVYMGGGRKRKGKKERRERKGKWNRVMGRPEKKWKDGQVRRTMSGGRAQGGNWEKKQGGK